MRSADTKGRVYPEQEHAYRTCYQRDRDRVVHSAAFRRLEYKTQVFVNHEGDYYRTRLTHTLEVAQIARTIARVLRLNQDLVEAIALAHDVGHTPYGHAGEEALRELMQDHGGFEHNRQSLRAVDILEERYPNFKGLNLSWEVREGLAKHRGRYDQPLEIAGFNLNEQPTLEAQVVNIADEIAYDNHDLDDGVTSKLINLEQLRTVDIWESAFKIVDAKNPHLKEDILKYQIIRNLIEVQITDLIGETERKIKEFRIKSVADVTLLSEPLVSFSKDLQKKREEIREFLLTKLYNHYRVVRMSHKAKRFIRELFQIYLSDIRQLPSAIQERIKIDGEYKAICDYIAGMTDRFVEDEYKKLFTPFEKV
ncbi:MAG: deoxyguanosinetriphosphate triphosphohydrolase [Candidatus Omnitrophota bacterium]|nr:deoxyguanosinetriphosphate triphosphohydrolase [Candidatus Omnitrophota bacterium]